VTDRIDIAKLIMLVTIVTAGGRTSPAADWSGNFNASASGAYVTNPRSLPGVNVADQTALLTVDGSTIAETERGHLSVTPRFSITRYRRDTDLDHDTGSIDFNFVEKLERGHWTFAGQALTDSTLTSELGTTGVTHVNLRHDLGTASLGYQYWSSLQLTWQLQGSYQITRYSDAGPSGLNNYNYGSVQVGPTWSFSERLQGSLTVGADWISPQVGRAQQDKTVSLELKRNLNEKYAWRFSVGAARVESRGVPLGTSSLFELGVSRKGERTQWDLSVRRSIEPIGTGLLAQENVATLTGAVGTSERSSLNLYLNAIRTYPAFYLESLVYSGASWGQAGAEWKYHLSPNWVLSAAYQQARSRSGSLQQWANGTQARLGILWQSGRL